MRSKFSIVIYRYKPDLTINLPFITSETMARATFSRLSFCLNSSIFDKIILCRLSSDEFHSQIITMANLNGSYK